MSITCLKKLSYEIIHGGVHDFDSQVMFIHFEDNIIIPRNCSTGHQIYFLLEVSMQWGLIVDDIFLALTTCILYQIMT